MGGHSRQPGQSRAEQSRLQHHYCASAAVWSTSGEAGIMPKARIEDQRPQILLAPICTVLLHATLGIKIKARNVNSL